MNIFTKIVFILVLQVVTYYAALRGQQQQQSQQQQWQIDYQYSKEDKTNQNNISQKSQNYTEQQQSNSDQNEVKKILQKKTVYDHHECVHSKMQKQHYENVQIRNQELKNDVEHQQNEKRRKLAAGNFVSPHHPGSAEVGPMRLTFDFSELDATNDATNDQKNFIKGQIEVAKAFYYKRLQVIRKTENLKYAAKGYQCAQHIPPTADTDVGIPDSDFHFYVTAKNEDKNFLAWASFCQQEEFSDGSGRPVFGQIHYNTLYLTDTGEEAFAQSMETTLHEVAHALVFSSGNFGLFPFYRNEEGKFYGTDPTSSGFDGVLIGAQQIRGLETDLIVTPKVKEWVKEHYGCSSAKGMQLENQGEQGSTGSHWERTIIYDEVMTASRFGPTKTFSGATFALFKDSGWYIVNDDFVEKLQWGYQKGCEFLDKACKSTTQKFDEFCDTAGETKCTGGREGKGVCITDQTQLEKFYFMDAGCGIVNPYGNAKCIAFEDANSDSQYLNSGQTYQYFGYDDQNFDSRCFQSSIGGGQAQCYRYDCQADGKLVIKFKDDYTKNEDSAYNSDTAICLYKGQQHINKAGKMGTLTCPDPVEFCEQRRKFCPNWCSKNGYCSDGVCVCRLGYGGEDCSIIGNVGNNCGTTDFQSDTGKVLKENYKDIATNDKCESTTDCCDNSNPAGCTNYVNTFNRVCSKCSIACNTCVGGADDSCETCQSGLFLLEEQEGVGFGRCVSQCPEGYWGDDSSANDQEFKCVKCTDLSGARGCKSCTKAGMCTSCNSPDFLDVPEADRINLEKPPYQGNCRQSKEDCVATFFDIFASTCFTICPQTRERVGQDCIKCQDGKFMNSLSVCVDSCEDGFYPDKVEAACSSCDDECGHCFAGTSNSCVTCKQNIDPALQTYLFGNRCIKIQSCPAGSYGKKVDENDFQCVACEDECLSCEQNGTSCTSCKLGFIFKEATNECLDLNDSITCPESQYADKINRTCENCDANCLSCSKETQYHCLSCHQDIDNKYFLAGVKSTCQKTCPKGYYYDQNNICKTCHSTCDQCVGDKPNQCTVCRESYYKFQDEKDVSIITCQYRCPKYYYGKQETVTVGDGEDAIKVEYLECFKCHESCLNCSGPSIDQCTKCDDENYLESSSIVEKDNSDKSSLNKGKCVTKCSNKLIPNEITRECSTNLLNNILILSIILISIILI